MFLGQLHLLGLLDVYKRQAQSQAPEFVLTYAENQAEDYPTTQGAYKFAELVRDCLLYTSNIH